MSISSAIEILNKLQGDDKLNYNQHKIEELYKEHLDHIDETNKQESDVDQLFRNKTLLLLGSGKSIITDRDKILSIAEREDTVVVSINCIPEQYPLDYLFISNDRRYNLLFSQIKYQNDLGVIITSNVSGINYKNCYRVRYDRLQEQAPGSSSNSLILFLNLIRKIPVKKIYLAGFDGFSLSQEDNYYQPYLQVDYDPERIKETNKEMKQAISGFRRVLPMETITKSMYFEGSDQ